MVGGGKKGSEEARELEAEIADEEDEYRVSFHATMCSDLALWLVYAQRPPPSAELNQTFIAKSTSPATGIPSSNKSMLDLAAWNAVLRFRVLV